MERKFISWLLAFYRGQSGYVVEFVVPVTSVRIQNMDKVEVIILDRGAHIVR